MEAELGSHLSTAELGVQPCLGLSPALPCSRGHSWAGKGADGTTGDGKGQHSLKEIPFFFSSRKTCLPTLKLILKAPSFPKHCA